MYSYVSDIAIALRSRVTSCDTLTTLAVIAEDESTTDMAILIADRRLALVRCVNRAEANHSAAVASMVAQGDFVWGGLVYRDSCDTIGVVESFPATELDRVVERLREVQAAAQ